MYTKIHKPIREMGTKIYEPVTSTLKECAQEGAKKASIAQSAPRVVDAKITGKIDKASAQAQFLPMQALKKINAQTPEAKAQTKAIEELLAKIEDIRTKENALYDAITKDTSDLETSRLTAKGYAATVERLECELQIARMKNDCIQEEQLLESIEAYKFGVKNFQKDVALREQQLALEQEIDKIHANVPRIPNTPQACDDLIDLAKKEAELAKLKYNLGDEEFWHFHSEEEACAKIDEACEQRIEDILKTYEWNYKQQSVAQEPIKAEIPQEKGFFAKIKGFFKK